MILDFLKHLFPRAVLEKNLRFTYTFCLGGLAFTAFLLMLASGMLIAVYYQPVPEGAYRSVLFLESSVWGGWYIRSVHRMSSHFFLAFMLLHILRVILTGAYHHPRHMNWLVGVMLLFCGVFGAYTGYLLPCDQLAYWATLTGMELFRTIPFGDALHSLLVPDGIGRPLSLLRFYILHIMVLPLSILLLSMLHFYRVRKNKGVLPYL